VKLSQDQIKKIGLSLIGLVALVYCYFSFLLGPLQSNRDNMINTTADLESKVAGSKKTMEQTAQLERTAVAAIGLAKTVDTMIPEGAPLAWVPPRIKSFFASDGVDAGAIRLLTTFPLKQPELAAYAIDDWLVDFPRADFLVLARSIARFENENPLWSVASVRIKANEAELGLQTVTLGIRTLVKK
jgi:hypothetical protein